MQRKKIIKDLQREYNKFITSRTRWKVSQNICMHLQRELKELKDVCDHSRLRLVWFCGVVIITTAQLHSIKPELRFCTGSNPACEMLEVRDGEDFWQWSQLRKSLNSFCWWTIPQKQFIIIMWIGRSNKTEKSWTCGKENWKNQQVIIEVFIGVLIKGSNGM